MPFLMAAGTSFAFPVPKPTIFAPGSPTTTSAEKLRFLPPLTTFVTRLIETTCSLRFRLFDSMRFVIGAAIRTPVPLHGLHQPTLSRGRDRDIRRDRTLPCRFPFPWRV